MNPRRRRSPTYLVLTLGIIIGIVLILVISAPRVEEFNPPPGSDNVSSMSRISMRFSRPMNTLTVESRLQIDPAQSGKSYWDGQTYTFEPNDPWPANSTVNVTLSSGSLGANRLPMIGQRSWTFSVGLPSLVYLWPGEGKSDLYQIALEPESEPKQLTESELGILDYSVGQDGSLLVYSANRLDGGTELHAYDLISSDDRVLLTCDAEAPCSAPALSPDGTWLAFEQVEYRLGLAGRLVPSSTSVWLMSTMSATDAFQISAPEHTATNPNWSPTGWLVYFDDRLKALALVNPGENLDPVPFNYIPTSLGIVGSWSPDGTRLVYPDIIFPEEDELDEGVSRGESSPLYYSHLYMVDITTGRTLDISPGGDWMVEDASPSFSPDGTWVAFTRKFLDPERWSPGRQVWLMNAETSEIKPLSDEPGATFSSLAWSPESKHLAFMRKHLADLSRPSEIWLVDVISGEASMVVEGAFLPGWLP
jgi:Tol biopolymer transport system component